MKKIFFPATNRVHLARQKILLEKLEPHFEVQVRQFDPLGATMAERAASTTEHFYQQLELDKPDIVLVRGDRAVVLSIAMMAAYMNIPIAHIEGGCETGASVIDSRVRHAISHLSNIHFVTDKEAQKNLISKGIDIDSIFNVGSLDVSFAAQVEPVRQREGDYILLTHHGIPGEPTSEVYDAIKDIGVDIVGIKSNSDYMESIMHEEYSAENFVNLMRYAACVVGNSSAICKEASVLGVPCVLTGTRQDGRLIGKNVMRVPHEKTEIAKSVRYQIEHGRYDPDLVYYQSNTEEKIVDTLKIYAILQDNSALGSFRLPTQTMQ